MVPPPCDRAYFTDRGDFWGFNSKRIRTAFNWSDFSVNLMDLDTNIGFYWVKTVTYLPMWVFAAPLRTLFHWWMEKNERQLIHAAAVGTKDGAVIITGKDDVGKSTTALSCLKNEMFYLANDYLIVKLDPEPVVQSLYCTVKLLPDDLKRFPEFSNYIKQSKETNYNKLLFFLYPALKDQIIPELPLKAILTSEVKATDESCFSEIPYKKILGALSFTTMSQLPYAGKYTQDYIYNLVDKLPCYLLELGKDLDGISQLLKNFLSGESKPSVLNRSTDTGNSRPLISIIIPVYNGEKFIHEAVENILSQSYPSIEIIFINDGSIDNSEKIIKELKIDYRYFYRNE